METDIIKTSFDMLPDEYKLSTITVRGMEVPLYSYMQGETFAKIKESMTDPNEICEYITTKLDRFINKSKLESLDSLIPKEEEVIEEAIEVAEEVSDYDVTEELPNILPETNDSSDIDEIVEEREEEKVDNSLIGEEKAIEFINEMGYFISFVKINEDEYLDVRNHIIEYAKKNYQSDGTLKYPGKNITFLDFYKKILNNTYFSPTIEDKSELLIDMTKYIDEDVLKSNLELEHDEITVEEYLTRVVPSMMSDISHVKLYDEEIELLEFVGKIVKHQKKHIEQIEKEETEKNIIQYGNPGEVGTIEVNYKDDGEVELTTQIPTIKSGYLEEDELSSVLENYDKIDAIADEDYYMDQLNRLKEAIDKTNNDQDLKDKAALFQELENEITLDVITPNLQVMMDSIRDAIMINTKHTIKVNANQEEYIDTIEGRLNEMRSKIQGCQTLDELSKIQGEIAFLNGEILAKGITDIHIKETLANLSEERIKKYTVLNLTLPDRPPEYEQEKNELDSLVLEIKNELLEAQYNPNNRGQYVGSLIRLENKIEELKDKVKHAYYDEKLQSDEAEYYNNLIDHFSSTVKIENNVSLGVG